MNISVLSSSISMPLNNCLFLPIQQYFALWTWLPGKQGMFKVELACQSFMWNFWTGWPIQSGFNHNFKDTDLPDTKRAHLRATGREVGPIVRQDLKSEPSGWWRMQLVLLFCRTEEKGEGDRHWECLSLRKSLDQIWHLIRGDDPVTRCKTMRQNQKTGFRSWASISTDGGCATAVLTWFPPATCPSRRSFTLQLLLYQWSQKCASLTLWVISAFLIDTC